MIKAAGITFSEGEYLAVKKMAAAMAVDIEVGDVILVGRYKNKREVVKEIGVDDLGQPTVNGRKLLTLRIEKKLPDNKKSRETRRQSQNAKSASALDHITPAMTSSLVGGGVGALASLLRSRQLEKRDKDNGTDNNTTAGTLRRLALATGTGATVGYLGNKGLSNYVANTVGQDPVGYFNVDSHAGRLRPKSIRQLVNDVVKSPNLETLSERIADVNGRDDKSLYARAELLARGLNVFDDSKGTYFKQLQKTTREALSPRIAKQLSQGPVSKQLSPITQPANRTAAQQNVRRWYPGLTQTRNDSVLGTYVLDGTGYADAWDVKTHTSRDEYLLGDGGRNLGKVLADMVLRKAPFPKVNKEILARKLLDSIMDPVTVVDSASNLLDAGDA